MRQSTTQIVYLPHVLCPEVVCGCNIKEKEGVVLQNTRDPTEERHLHVGRGSSFSYALNPELRKYNHGKVFGSSVDNTHTNLTMFTLDF